MKIKNILGLLLFIFGFFLSACSKDEPPVEGNNVEKVVLMYAISSNDLYSDFKDDKAEALIGLQDIDLNKYKYLIYSVTPTGTVKLEEVVKSADGNTCEYKTIKSFLNKPLSTDPARMTEVIDDVRSLYGTEASYGLILWSHSMSWSYGGTPHTPTPSNSPNSEGQYKYDPVQDKWFGVDQTGNKNDFMDIDELASAIPSGVFDFIWFDSCYMGGIEVAYQLRNKCKYMIAYPTEIYSMGAPYDRVFKHIFKKGEFDVVGLAKEVFDYYNVDNLACTVAVMDMSQIENIANKSSEILKDYRTINASSLQKYSRGTAGPYYDFVQYLEKAATKSNPNFDFDNFRKAMDKFVIYKDCSARDFSSNYINKDNYSGLSTHCLMNDDSESTNFYKGLDWYKATYGK